MNGTYQWGDDPWLAQGSVSNAVGLAQTVMDLGACGVGPQRTDGVYGSFTAQEVACSQWWGGVPQNGALIDGRTWDALQGNIDYRGQSSLGSLYSRKGEPGQPARFQFGLNTWKWNNPCVRNQSGQVGGWNTSEYGARTFTNVCPYS
jgi:hypothetical protein